MPPEETPDFPQVPLTGVTELRIHGVSGTPVESMLEDPHPVQVWGDPLAGFYRRKADGNAGTDHLEAYSWGRLTAGASARAAWLLLLPFMLVNVASWAHPARRGTRSGPVGTMSGALRVLALTMTLTFALAAAVLTMDVVGWQCGAVAACEEPHWYTRWMPSDRPGVRVAAWSLVPALLVVLVWWLSRSTTKRYERFGDETPPPSDPPGTPPGITDMGNRRFWQGRGPVSRLRAMHVSASLAFVAALVAYGTRPAEGGGRTLGTLLATVATLLIVVVAVILATPLAGRRRDLFEGNPPSLTFCRAVMRSPFLALGLYVLAALYAVTRGTVPATEAMPGPLPGAQGAKHALVAVQVAAVLTLLGANVVAHLRRDKANPDSAHGPLLAGQLATFLAILGTSLAAAFVAGLTFRVADYLGCPAECEEGGGFDFDLPAEYLTAARSFAAAVLLLLPAALYVVLVVRRRLRRAAAANVVTEYPDHTTAERRKQIAKIQAGAALTDHATWPLAFAVLGGIAIGVAYAFAEWLPGDDELASAGTWLVGFFALGLVALGRLAYHKDSMRRTVGIAWDLGTFWPRAVHPFAPPCYCERTVPEFVTRITQTRNATGDVVVSAHSQGTVIAFAALLQLRDQPAGLAMVTYGSPLHRLYARAFPHFFGLPVLTYARGVLGNRWINLYRRSDPIGGPVTTSDADVPATAVRPDRRLRDPAFARPQYAFNDPVSRGHSNYFHDPAFAETVGVLANEVRGL